MPPPDAQAKPLGPEEAVKATIQNEEAAGSTHHSQERFCPLKHLEYEDFVQPLRSQIRHRRRQNILFSFYESIFILSLVLAFS